MNINVALEDLIRNNPIFNGRSRSKDKLNEYFDNFSKSYSNLNDCIIVGNSGVADRFMTAIGSNEFVAIADPGTNVTNINAATKRVRGVKVISVPEVVKEKFETCIILENQISKETNNYIVSESKNIISVFDEIKLTCTEALGAYCEFSASYTTEHERTMFLRRKYEGCSQNMKSYYLESIMFSFLSARDFVSYYKYSHKYIEGGYDSDSLLSMFNEKLDILLGDIKNALQSRNKLRDILFVWNDGVRYDEFLKMDYLGNELAQKSFVFDSAYATVYDTRATMATIFNKRYQIDDYYRSEDDCDIDNSLLVKKLKNYGYVIKGRYSPNLSDKKNTTDMDLYDLGSRKLWNCISQVIDEKSPAFIFIHELPETHNPYHNPYVDKDYYFIRGCKKDDYENQINQSRSYWDAQLKFYMQFFDYENYKIFMSDHGKPLDIKELITLQETYKNEYVHVMLEISGNGILPGRGKELFSLINIYELICQILDDKIDINSLYSDEIMLQSIDRYNPGDIRKKLEDGTEKRNLMSYRAIKTKKDMLVIFRDGVIKYFDENEKSTEFSDREELNSRVSYLKNKVGDNFVDIYADDFFAASRQLYE